MDALAACKGAPQIRKWAQMVRSIRGWLTKHTSFNTYITIAKLLEPIEWKIDLLRYILFTETKEGKCLRGTGNPKVNIIVHNALYRSLPYVALLFATAGAPSVLPQHILDLFPKSILDFMRNQLDSSLFSSFIPAALAIAGIFLTLFYTSVTTVFSNKFPSGNGDVTKLFVELVSSDDNLGYCTSFVVVASLSFIFYVTGFFNGLAFLYFLLLTMALIGKLASAFSLGTGKTGITAVSAIPANKFLTLARASSFDGTFYDSKQLVLNFKKIANRELTLLDSLMDYSLTAGDYALPYSKAVDGVVLETLAQYSRIAPTIDTESDWHATTSSHKTWFMSPSYEVGLAVSTGTIPQPEQSVDRFGYQRSLYHISEKYSAFLIANNKVAEYSEFMDLSRVVLEFCIRNGDIEWAKDYSERLLAQCLQFSRSIDVAGKEDLRAKCHLLEQYAVTLLTIPLELRKLCDGLPQGAFHFDSFSSFSQAELQKQGFPLGDDAKMRDLCEKVSYEKSVFDVVETPKWWFNKKVDSIGLEAVERLCSDILLLHKRYCSTIGESIASDPGSSYILALKEAELFSKSEKCLESLQELAKTHFDVGALSREYAKELEGAHAEQVGAYPELAKSFMKDETEVGDFFPDLYGFVFFNYYQLRFNDIVSNHLASFCSSIVPLYQLVVISLVNLREKVSDDSYSNIFKVQILSEPTIAFIELCGMAYVMAELYEDYDSQGEIVCCVEYIKENDQSALDRWNACIDLSSNVMLGTRGVDFFSWRRRFLEAVSGSGKYPSMPRYTCRGNLKPPAGKERLLRMLPSRVFEFNDFSGCKIFKDFILESEGSDRQDG